MKTIVPHVARIFLGLTFLVFGLNGFLHFLPMPPPPVRAAAFLGLLSGSYLLAFVKGTEVVVGALLLTNRLVPLALTVLAPVMLNIVLVHALYTPPQTLALPLLLLTAQLYLAWVNRHAYGPLFRSIATRAEPTERATSANPRRTAAPG